jgi:hypothetical protein
VRIYGKTMLKQLVFHDRTMEVKLSERAVQQDKKLNLPLIIEIQIYFSCLLGKRLAFYTDRALDGAWQVEPELFSSMLGDARQLTENIFIRFNTVMTKTCPVSDYAGPPPVTDFKIKNLKPYVPTWLRIDYQNGLWCGEYGWPASVAGQMNTKQVRGNAILART